MIVCCVNIIKNVIEKSLQVGIKMIARCMKCKGRCFRKKDGKFHCFDCGIDAIVLDKNKD